MRRLDLQLDKFQIASNRSRAPSAAELGALGASQDATLTVQEKKLKAIVRSLSTTSASRPLLRKEKLCRLLGQATTIESDDAGTDAQFQSREEEELRWMIVAKATVQSYGLILSALFDQTIPITNEIWYWDDVLGSYAQTGLYTLQTSPARLWTYAQDIYSDARDRYSSRSNARAEIERTTQSISERWRRFYGLVQESVRERSLTQASTKVLSPFALSRNEARKKQASLKKLREMNSSGIGLLVDEGLSFGPSDVEPLSSKDADSPSPNTDEWRSTVAKSIALMESILRNVTSLENSINDFEENVFTAVEDDPVVGTAEDGSLTTADPTTLMWRIILILEEHLCAQTLASTKLFRTYGRPSRLARYWLPCLIGFFSGSTLLRILTSRRTEISTWIRDFGSTCVDFWFNWVVTPVKNLIGTIRHDSASEVAIMSRDSLRADRDSLERMVVDFVVDHPSPQDPSTSTETIRAKVQQGDLTPVLLAYERDLRHPFSGTHRGDLIRALLIQIQKTKVDVELATSGIDSLLKSQSLIFSFLGLTPGLLITYTAAVYLSSLVSRHRTTQAHRGALTRSLRNVSRILTAAVPTPTGLLSYKDHGLLLLEVHALRTRAAALVPGSVARDFREDVEDLVEVRGGVERQRAAAERIRWAYGRWLG